MKNAIIIHGMPSKEEYFNPAEPAQSNKHWLPWIQRQMFLAGILAQSIEMPEPYDPDYKKWSSVFEQFKIDKDTVLIGHSLGAGFLIRWLSENKVKVGKVALVAPFLDPDHDEVKSDFFNFKIDELLVGRTDGLKIFYSTSDEQEILTSVEQIRKSIPGVDIKEFSDRGHFTFEDMKTEKFPELLDWVI